MVRNAIALGASAVCIAACTTLFDIQEGILASVDAGDDASGQDATGTDASARDAITTDGAPEGSHDGSPHDDAALDAGDGGGSCSQGTTCVAEAPDGWSGPVAFYQGAPGPSCPPGFDTVLDGGAGQLSWEAGTCACSCGQPQGLECLPSIAYLQYGACNILCDVESLAQSCGNSLCGNPGGVSVSSPPLLGVCTAITAPEPTPSWPTTGLACSPSTPPPACGAGQVCAKNESGFYACILNSSDVPCPDGGAYPNKILVYDGYDDTRSCNPACTCGASAGGACIGGSFDIYAGTSCSMASKVGNYPIPSACVPNDLGGIVSAYLVSPPSPDSTNAACPPSPAGTPTGSVTPVGPHTVCCQ